ncbi:MAG: NUDIX domain-containing protein, partial [Longicatena sp.]
MKTIRVVGAVIKQDNSILIARRLKGEFKGLWEFPGGKIENSETPQQALIREIKEEMETTINIQEFLMTAEYDYSTFHLSMDCF